MMYSLPEVLPFLYSDINEDPSINFDAFDEKIHVELEDVLYDLLKSQYGSPSIELNLPEFTATSDDGETRTFPAKVFHFSRPDAEKELSDSYEGKTWYSYDFKITDLDSQDIYSVSTEFYNSEVTGFNVVLAEPEVAKTNFFVMRTGAIAGFYTSLEQASDKAHDEIAEVPENSEITLVGGHILEAVKIHIKP